MGKKKIFILGYCENLPAKPLREFGGILWISEAEKDAVSLVFPSETAHSQFFAMLHKELEHRI